MVKMHGMLLHCKSENGKPCTDAIERCLQCKESFMNPKSYCVA